MKKPKVVHITTLFSKPRLSRKKRTIDLFDSHRNIWATKFVVEQSKKYSKFIIIEKDKRKLTLFHYNGDTIASFDVGIAPVVIGIFGLASIQILLLGIIGEYVGILLIHLRNLSLVVEKERINF